MADQVKVAKHLRFVIPERDTGKAEMREFASLLQSESKHESSIPALPSCYMRVPKLVARNYHRLPLRSPRFQRCRLDT